eukprot:tig00000057_g40.t1
MEEFETYLSRTQNIKDVLQNYPPGPQILRAHPPSTIASFVVDLRSNHPTEGLVDTGGGRLGARRVTALQRAPALLAYNDRPFTKEDFESLRSLGASKKAQNASKIGQWGYGFTSIYHLTDLPGLVSSGHFVLFDPHAPSGGIRFPLGALDPDAEKPITFAAEYAGQLAPYAVQLEGGTGAGGGARKELFRMSQTAPDGPRRAENGATFWTSR